MRQVSAVRAFFGNLCVGGLGYLYLGRPFLAIVSWILPIFTLVGFAASRILLIPAGLYFLIITLVAMMLFFPIHAAMIAVRNKNLPAKKYNKWWVYVLWFAVSSAFASQFIPARAQLLGYETFRVPSISNSPTVEKGDWFIANTWRFKSHSPEVGEFVVFSGRENVKYIKRLVGLPEDTIELHDGVVYRNGVAANEPYLHEHIDSMPYGRDKSPIKLGSDEYYVLGDFRDNSQDSRTMGPIKLSQLHGRAEYIWFSFSDGSIHWDRFGRSLLPSSSDNRGK